jgi:hypothetical protein
MMFVSRNALYHKMVNLLCELGVHSLHPIIVDKDRSSSTLLFIFFDSSLHAGDCWYDDAGLRLAGELDAGNRTYPFKPSLYTGI